MGNGNRNRHHDDYSNVLADRTVLDCVLDSQHLIADYVKVRDYTKIIIHHIHDPSSLLSKYWPLVYLNYRF